jgi:mono/diheme cytochrome c family protein
MRSILNLRFAVLAAWAVGVLPAAALANPFPDADLANGKAVYQSKQCAACHMQKTGRDEAFIYQRDDRKVKSLFELRRYVSLCNMELKLDLFPEEERDVGAYLNQQYYKLDK